jgi:hypothetical protein
MDGAELKEIQRPLKDQYRSDPERAVVTLRAEGSLSESEVACSVQTGRALVEAGLHPATGGDGSLACSGDMLLRRCDPSIRRHQSRHSGHRHGPGRRGSRFPGHAWRRPRRTGRFPGHPIDLRALLARVSGRPGCADSDDGALLRRLPDPGRLPGSGYQSVPAVARPSTSGRAPASLATPVSFVLDR